MRNIRSKKHKKRDLPEINTTALPDIIFMLLFFFMVVTVLKKSEQGELVLLPNTKYSDLLKSDYSKDINLSLQKIEEQKLLTIDDAAFFITNETESKILVDQIKKSISKRTDFPQQAILSIDKNVKMKIVNLIKEALQENDIYNIECLTLQN